MTYTVKNWANFQNYSQRNPPWIRLYRTLLDSQDYAELSPASAKVLTLLWLLASEDSGRLPSVKKMAFRLRMTEKQLESLLLEICERGFLESQQDDSDASSTQAACKQHVPSEERRVEESRVEAETDFECFWRAYPKKRNKGDAEKAWKKLNPPLAKILDALEWQRQQQSWTKDGGQFVPYPASYLNAKGWEDEPIAPPEPFDPFANLTRAVTEAEADWMMGLTDEKP